MSAAFFILLQKILTYFAYLECITFRIKIMALDNIQKSLLAVLGISGMAAFLTPTGLPKSDDKQNAGVTAEGEVMPPAPPPKLVAPPPPVNTTSSTPAPMPAFGEPTISGLPYGQSPNQTGGGSGDKPSSANGDNDAQTNPAEQLVEGTITPSGGLVKNGEVVY
jgi:hypothetical protein